MLGGTGVGVWSGLGRPGSLTDELPPIPARVAAGAAAAEEEEEIVMGPGTTAAARPPRPPRPPKPRPSPDQ